jgi:putative PIN family toxin of toxin-antitoxin system
MTSAIKLPRVVIDTNRILSAVVFAQGRLTPLRLAWQGKRIQPLVCKDTAAELIRVLACPKFKLSAEDQQELLADYLTCCLSVVIPNPPPVTPDCRDAFDLPFLQLAAAGYADFLITGDQDLLSITDAFTCPVLSVDQFLKTINP